MGQGTTCPVRRVLEHATTSYRFHVVVFVALEISVGRRCKGAQPSTAQILIICENDSFPVQGVVSPQKKYNFQLHALRNNVFRKKIAKKSPPPLPARAASMSEPWGGCCLPPPPPAGFVQKWSGHVFLNCISVSAFHVPRALLWTNLELSIEKLVGLNHPKHFLVGVCLCYGLQSQGPTDPHLYACVGMDCKPRVQGTPGPLQWNQNK